MAFINFEYCPMTNAVNVLDRFARQQYRQFYDLQLIKIGKDAEYFINHLRKDLNVLMEYPYIDKVYRDSYYKYFATKFKDYPRDCIRLSFFEKGIKKEDFSNSRSSKKLKMAFLGYCIIRPTKEQVIGRNLVSKHAVETTGFDICQHTENVMVYGEKLEIRGFPHSSQDKESISCAETTLWAIMEYFGHKYPEYAPTLPSRIIEFLDRRTPTRMLPSNGLTAEQIASALKEFGFGPQIYHRDYDEESYMELMKIYVESGIPVINIIDGNKDNTHAQIVIGRKRPSLRNLKSLIKKCPNNLISYSNGVENLVYQDDNLPPYQIMRWDNPTENYPNESSFDGLKSISFVTPLYRKIYLEAGKAKSQLIETLMRQNDYELKTKWLYRIYLASSRSFKTHVKELKKLNAEVKNILLSLSLPKFIWVGEFSEIIDIQTFNDKMASSLIILDATESSDFYEDSFIFAAQKDKVYVKIEDVELTKKFKTTILTGKHPFTGFEPYFKNLT